MKGEKHLEKRRIKWLNKVCREARDEYGFSCLSELVEFMIQHASEIQLKSGDIEVTDCESVYARSLED